ncbi:hypothetical protein [Cryptosporangium minutisporangium]|uniref:Baseplate protein J-like domain-containing protein n=1 Tax=Cryptosporangium minutisporangium TaxID=113569 RepID=A0ABP6SRK4_9ACTN
MPERHLLPIPLPRGRTGNTGHLTVYFSPRLREKGPLSGYPDWRQWATTVNALTLRVVVDGVLTTPTRVTPGAEPALWNAVFAPNTPVKAHRPTDWTATPLETMPVSDFSEAVLALYARIAADHPDAPPTGDNLLALPEALFLADPDGPLTEAVDHVRPMTGDRLEEARDPEWDFHELISLLGHHPELLRYLGIAVDLQVALPANPTTVVVRTNYENMFGADAHEVSVAMATTPAFLAKPNPDPEFTEQIDGFLRLRTQKAFLSIMDIHSTAARLQGLDGRLPDHPGTLPALTTRALTLVRPDLLAAFKNRNERQGELEKQVKAELGGGAPVQVFAEDVSVGLRIDVLADDVWRSLFQRRTDTDGYHFPRDPALDRVPKPDEAWVTTQLVTELIENIPDANEDRDDPIERPALRRLDDQLYRWDGWSGAVRPPGGAVDGATGKVAELDADEPRLTDPVQFSAGYGLVPATLPRLRFGERYAMRARCVDLAGNSPALAAPTPPGADTVGETFGRLEPIAAPFVVRRAERPVPGVGDEAVTLVLRSDYDLDDSTVAPAERLLFPGRVGQDLCELHGEPKGGADPASYQVIADRDARAPHDGWTRDPVTGEPIAAGDAAQQIAYLSDPLVSRLRAFHHGQRKEFHSTVEGTWPAVTSSRVEAVAGTTGTDVNPDDDTDLRFSVAKADIWTVDLSYAPRAGEVEKLGLWHQLTPADQTALRSTIEDGGHWMFSARRPVQLVHAVRRPLLAPRVLDWTGVRTDDSTAVTITADVEVERRSTERFTLAARWTDLVDDLTQPGPAPRPGGAALGRFLTPRAVGTEFDVVAHRAELGDTKRHLALIELEAFSSFSAYFTEERSVTVATNSVLVDRRGFAGGTVKVRAADGRKARLGPDYTVDAARGTITRTPRGDLTVGELVTVRYVPLPVSRSSGEHPAFEVLFLNTATPPPPVVADVVPAFARSRRPVVDGEDVTHDGTVVRLYLERPWNVTGDGESLAVLVERTPGAAPAATCVGRDPIVGPDDATTALSAASFPRATRTVDAGDGVHDLALHAVAYDEGSRRWYADIAVATGLYRPFLRLEVARYQADSVPGKSLSSPVTVEPVRLGVGRSVSVRAVGDSYDVVVTGVEHGGVPSEGRNPSLVANELVVVHQQADPAIADEDLRWLTDVQSVVLTRSADQTGSTWSGRVAVAPSATPQRFVIEELEPALVGAADAVVTGRVVYTEVVALPAG